MYLFCLVIHSYLHLLIGFFFYYIHYEMVMSRKQIFASCFYGCQQYEECLMSFEPKLKIYIFLVKFYFIF